VQRADARLEALRHIPTDEELRPVPTALSTPKVLHDRDFVPEADLPKPTGHWETLEGATVDPDLVEAETQANQAHDSRLFLSLLTLAVFSLPLVWYLLLDRIREISAAVSGRDKSN
jgi:hypothetical protein